jgi:ribonuclease HI
MKEVWPLPACEDIQNTGSEWILHALSSTSEQVRMMMMMMTWWWIWHVRNEVVHLKPAPPIEASRRFLRSYVDSLLCIKQNPTMDPTKGKTVVKYEHNAAKLWKKKVLDQKQANQIKWSKPAPGWSKLNVDGSWMADANSGGIGMILQDDQGVVIFSACQHHDSCGSPIEAELRACVEGLALAMRWRDCPIILETDCLEAVQMINDETLNRSPVAGLVNEVKRLCSSASECRVVHISRIINGVSHSLAQFGRVQTCSNFWVRSGPEEIRLACIKDDTPIP